jgi:N-acetylglucosaminyldiphosphoundecaprenol N-acetyl-beta-D-mannosaminyltransferase
MIERANILGVGVSALNLLVAVETIESWIRVGRREYVCVTGVHGIIESRRGATVRAIHNTAGLVVPDGMPLVWLLRRGGYRNSGRVYGPDLMLRLLERSLTQNFTHFLYGATEATLVQLRAKLTARFPGLRVVGSLAPPFRALTPAEDDAVVEAINRADPDIVWIGLSTPKQEIWMAEHRSRLNARVLLGVGAAFDIHAGRHRQAPGWMQRSGLEWLFRLCQEPRRLGRRYLYNNPRFVLEIIAQKTGLRKYPCESSVTNRASVETPGETRRVK